MFDIVTEKNERLDAIDGDFPLDEALLEALPAGSEVVSAYHFGDSAWTQTGCVTVQLEDGEEKKYFLKLALGDHGKLLLEGEYASISLLDTLLPGLVPKALACGKYRGATPETYFFIEDFKEMSMELPDPVELARKTKELHEHTSPNGLFGFEVTTFAGKVPHAEGWEASWTKCFSQLLRLCLIADEETNGVWPEMKIASEQILSVVVPRLLDPLQEGTNSIKPALIHGDLWSGNIGTDEETGELVFFDCGCFYAHSELELGMWRCDGQQNLGLEYLKTYQQLIRPSEPELEFDDRNRLYCMKFYLTHSAINPNDIARQRVFNDMVFLCDKYAPVEGLPKYDPDLDASWRRYGR